MTVWLQILKSATPGGTAILLSTWRTCEVSGVFTATLTSFFMGLATTVSPSVTYRAWLSMAGLSEDRPTVASHSESELNSSGSFFRRLQASVIAPPFTVAGDEIDWALPPPWVLAPSIKPASDAFFMRRCNSANSWESMATDYGEKVSTATNSELLGVPLKQQAAVVPVVSVCLFKIRQDL